MSELSKHPANSRHCLALVTEAFGGRGGIAQYNRDLLSALAASKDFSSITVVPRTACESFELPSNNIEQEAFIIAVLRTALLRPVDVIFCGHLYMAPLAALVARIRSAKLIVQMHGIEAWNKPSWAQRAAVEAADLVLCVSRYTRARLLGWAMIVPERVLVLPNTVEADFTPGDSPLRTVWGCPPKRALLTVGRLDSRERYKGHDRVIGVIPELVDRGLDVIYAIIGEGDDCRRLEALAREKGVADRVRFMGAVDRKMLVDAYRAADLFVMPSTGEGFGIAFLEAMASGTRALGLSTAGACDALADGELGAAVEESGLATAIATLLSVSARRRFGNSVFVSQAQRLTALCAGKDGR